MKLDGKRVLVTGAGGFIGSHLAERLVKEGCQVRALLHYDSRSDRSNLEFVDPLILQAMEIQSGDVCDPYSVHRLTKGCDVVFHLAALIGIPYSYVAPAAYVETNVQGTLHVLQGCLDNGVERVIHTSTSECYGTAQYVPINEDHPLCAQSPYSATKIAADKLAESFYRSFDLPVATIRPFNAYGPRQSARAVVPAILSRLLAGFSELRLGSLDPVRDLSFVADTVGGYLAVARSEQAVGTVVNVGSGSGIRIGDLAELAMQVVGRQVPIVQDPSRVRPQSSEVFSLICDNSRAERLVDWSPGVDLEEGLQKTAEFIERHLDEYRPEEYAT
jgi:NAD dependent epimerase/dehydratase